MSASIDTLINFTADPVLKNIAVKVKTGERITDQECLELFERADLPFAGALANFIREQNLSHCHQALHALGSPDHLPFRSCGPRIEKYDWHA